MSKKIIPKVSKEQRAQLNEGVKPKNDDEPKVKTNNIKIQILGPVGDVVGEIETDYPGGQLDRFLSQNRIVVFSDDEPVHFVSEKHRWPLNQNKDNE